MSRSKEPRAASARRPGAPSAADSVSPTDGVGKRPAVRRRRPGDACAGLNGLAEPAIVVGDDHRILDANDLGASLFAGERIVGRRCYEVLHQLRVPCAQAGERCPVSRLRDTDGPWRVVHVHHTARGEEHHEVSIYPFGGNGGNGAGGGNGEGERRSTFLEILRPVSVSSPRPCGDRLAGRSPAFHRMLELLLRVAPEETPVLLLGETGTGKRMVARAIHRLSGRPAGAFAALSCAGLAGPALERELYGGETAAGIPVQGKVEAARGGTLFLDDVGDLGAGEQGEVLRLVKTGAYRRPGDVRLWEADVRLVCGAHPSLRDRVAAGAFSPDLYFRIGAFPIELPPLRERRGDLPLLARSLLARMGLEPRPKIDRRTFAVLARHPLPGNLRELRRILEHACLEAGGGPIRPEHLPAEYRRQKST